MLTSRELIILRDLIQERIGIFLDERKLFNIYKKKIEKFMHDFGFDSFDAFLQALHDPILFQEFTNILTVNETYFFREAYQFDTLINHILPVLATTKPLDSAISILTSPCSSGEELYSIAIRIMESTLFHQRDFFLCGIDIDSTMILKAQKGVYSGRSLSKVAPNLLKKYFTQIDAHSYQIIDAIRSYMHFYVVNVLDHYAMKRLGTFDIIFSRNMLIYFDPKTRKKILATYHTILNDQGYLFLGHAESVPSDLALFRRLKFDDTILYQKITA